MLKKSLLLLTVISLNILPGFASEEQKEEETSFFTPQFTADQLQKFISHGEVKDNFKAYKLEKKDQEILYSYIPYMVQWVTKSVNPLEGRVNFRQASYQTINDYPIESLPEEVQMMIQAAEDREKEKQGETQPKTRFLTTFTGKYTLQGSYEKEPSAEISIAGSYDIFRLIFSNENFNENGLCLYRLQELDETFTNQTSNAHRLNQTLSKLFYVRKALQQPEMYPLTYNEAAEELGRKWFVLHMRAQGMSDEKCMKVLVKDQDVDQESVSLGAEFYTSTVNALRDDIYALMGIDKALLNSMYEGIGTHMINYNYTVAALDVARGS